MLEHIKDIPLWDYLKNTDKPIVLYGMGNGADMIIEVLESLSLTFSDVFASDGFVRGHSFHGKKVLTYSEIKEKLFQERPGTLVSHTLSDIRS